MRFVVACLVLLISTLAANAQEMQRAAPPLWVEELALPAIDPRLRAEAQGGVHFILADRQLQWQDQVMSSYTRTVSEVTDRAGLEAAATINIDFDPLFEAITLTRLALIRDGQSIDLRDTVRVEVLRREQRLDQGIIDGTLTLWIQIPDLRVGDLVDTASLRVMQPVLPGANRSLESFLDWSVPVQITRVLAFWPTDWPLHMAPLPEGIRHSQTPMPDGQTQRLEWQRLSRLPEQ